MYVLTSRRGNDLGGLRYRSRPVHRCDHCVDGTAQTSGDSEEMLKPKAPQAAAVDAVERRPETADARGRKRRSGEAPTWTLLRPAHPNARFFAHADDSPRHCDGDSHRNVSPPCNGWMVPVKAVVEAAAQGACKLKAACPVSFRAKENHFQRHLPI